MENLTLTQFKVGDVVRLTNGEKPAVITGIKDGFYPYRCKYLNSTTRFRAVGSQLVRFEPAQTMNLYILEGVLADYTGGMAVIAAPTEERAWDILREEFNVSVSHEKFNCEDVKVIEGVNHAEGVVSHMYGGG